MNLDSLTDMVSNAVGVLILLLLVTALQSSNPHVEPPLPIEHQSGLIPKFFYIHGDRIQTIDVSAAFANGLLAASEATSEQQSEFQVSADFMGRRHEYLTLTLTPIDTDKWPSIEALEQTDSILGKTAASIDATTDLAFIFVEDDGNGEGFSGFEKARQWFLDRGTAVGWIPVTENNPAYLCSWSNLAACRYSPSHYGTGK
jgi:hypothetical protein